MLHSAVLRRTLAGLGIAAAGLAPALPVVTMTLLGAGKAVAAPTPYGGVGHLPGDPLPEDIDDITGGIGGIGDLPPGDDEDGDGIPDDLEDITDGIGGHLP